MSTLSKQRFRYLAGEIIEPATRRVTSRLPVSSRIEQGIIDAEQRRVQLRALTNVAAR